ncbi:hypothetical protein VB780_06470 [Leptolyngbya sp. CCNP1308]|uniref:hypothetical protein n=1 Tax=Leptolyngbya sp. CCNP1308 TaxID=3110255 RepID=UPI002B216ABD|nr:hypothetical protein [Leptolyngbya sp. CCNP1308]MEA5448206.1 hypothetical protein [Leptolyngbya sp. CCNP1308]
MSSSHPRQASDLSAQVLETALGNYILLEVYRDAELRSPNTDPQGRSPNTDPEERSPHPSPDHSAPRPGLWSTAAVIVLGGLLTLLAIKTTPRAIASLSTHAQTTVAEMGIPTSWRF